ncbi:hypothetical protein ARMSODRAFT_1087744 [Armillaria solidipes]|uniref:DUF2306 domain-containing protein n=1 Tax=Armillaria solidipes TaxID=1076256 RepID=A0A2H3B7P5_9AGAR|nr:hypothetical protein ARMSODRAFT_1087744 [Armillaria solidipes]
MSMYSPRTMASGAPDPEDVFTTVNLQYGRSNENTDAAHQMYNTVPLHTEKKPRRKIPGRSAYFTISNIVGFKQRWSLLICFFFGGALLGFCLFCARMMNFSLMQKYAPAGQWFWYSQKMMKVNYAIHIYTSVFGGIFALFQFLPAIRRRAVIVHRLNGYFVLILLIPSNVCGAIVGYRAYGGEINTQSMYYILGIASAGCLIIGYLNVKKETRQHRKFMLRGVVIFSVVITTQLITKAARQIVTDIGNYYTVFQCDDLRTVLTNITAVEQQYPACAGDGVDLSSTYVPVLANAHGDKLHKIAATRVVQGMALWFALFIHIFGCEAYASTFQNLKLTEEANYQRRGYVLEPKMDPSLDLNDCQNSQ